MDDWMVLGLEQTEDRDAIKRAYMKQISLHNPEDDPEGFRRVRAAYEQILKTLDQANAEEEEEDTTPLGLFIRRVEHTYTDFDKRINPECWKELLTDEVCMRLDMEDETSTRLLRFIMDSYYIPNKVMRVLNDHFNWVSKADTLKQDFPGNFIDFVVNSTTSNEYLTYDRFEVTGIETPDSKTYDRWIYLYYEIENAVINQTNVLENEAAFNEMISEIEALTVRHAYYDLVKARMCIQGDQPEAALKLTETLSADCPDDNKVRYVHGLALQANKRPEEAAELFKTLLEYNARDFGAKRGLIECLIAQEDYEEARSLLLEILDDYPFNPFALNVFRYVTEKLIEIYEEKHKADPESHDTVLTLAKHYLNAYKYDECRTLLEAMTPAEDEHRYYEYLADCYANDNEYDKALELYRINVSTEKHYRNYVKYVSTLIDADKAEDAISITDEALTLEDDDTLSRAFLYDNKGLALHKLGRYEEALEAYDEGLRINNQVAHLFAHKAKTCQRMNRYAEAVDLCENAVGLYPYNTEAYTIQMEIFYDADLYDRMVALADLADQYHFESPRVKYFKACALRMKNEVEESEKILNELLEAEYDEGYRDYFHAELAYIAMSRRDYAAAIRNMEEAIRLNSEPLYRYTFLGNVHRVRTAYDEALGYYILALEKFPTMIAALIGRGNVYYDMKDYTTALIDFEAALAVNENNEQAFDRIIDTYVAQKRYNDAIPVAEREIKLFENLDNYLRLAWLYDRAEQQDAAEATYQTALSLYPESGRPNRSYGYYCKNSTSDYEKAAEHFRLSLEKQEDQPLMYSEIAYCLCQLKRYEEAYEIVNKGISLFDSTSDLYVRRGFVLSYLKRHQESLNDLLKALENEEALEERWNIAYIYNRVGIKYEINFNDAEQAMKYYRMVLERDEEYADAHKNIGDLYRYHYRKYKEAIKCYDMKIKLEPNEADGYLARAETHALRLRFSLAKADFRKALSIYEKELSEDPENICLYAHIGDCYVGLGDYDKARECFQRAIEHAPNSSECTKGICDEAYYGLGRICEKQKRYEEALKNYEIALKVVNSVQYNNAYNAMLKKKKK